MKYAIIQLGGKQFKITEGMQFEVDRQQDLSNMHVLMFSNDDQTLVGDPFLEKIKVDASIDGEKRAKKVRIARYKSKSRYRKIKGHRQPISVVKVKSILSPGEKPKSTSETAKNTSKVAKSEKAAEKPKKATKSKKEEKK